MLISAVYSARTKEDRCFGGILDLLVHLVGPAGPTLRTPVAVKFLSKSGYYARRLYNMQIMPSRTHKLKVLSVSCKVEGLFKVR